METKGPNSSSLDHQPPNEDYTQTKPNSYADLAFVPATDSNGNGYDMNENAPVHQGASSVTQVAVASSHRDDTKKSTEKAILNSTSQNGSAFEFVHPITNGLAEGITEGVSNLELNGEADHNTDGLIEGETNRNPTVEINGEAREEGYVNHDIIGPEDEDDGEDPVIPDRNIAVSGPAKEKKKPKSKRGLVT